MTANTDDNASLLDVEKGAEFALFAIDIDVENTSDEDISFYPDQSTIIISTKEQIEANMWFSEDVGGDFYGQVKKSGQVYFVIPNSVGEDINHIQWRIDAPFNSDFDNLTDNIIIELELIK